MAKWPKLETENEFWGERADFLWKMQIRHRSRFNIVFQFFASVVFSLPLFFARKMHSLISAMKAACGIGNGKVFAWIYCCDLFVAILFSCQMCRRHGSYPVTLKREQDRMRAACISWKCIIGYRIRVCYIFVCKHDSNSSSSSSSRLIGHWFFW